MRTPGQTTLPDKLLVRALRHEAVGVVTVLLEDPTGGPLPPWQPGSHVDLMLPGGITRQYSLCGRTDDRRSWRIGVLREPGSRGGSAFICEQLRPGATVGLLAVRNHFELVDAPSYCFVAGGIGITPILSMVDEVERQGRPWQLVYGGRRRASMAFAEELAAHGERVSVQPEDEVGLLDLPRILKSLAPGTAIFACGPEGLLAALEHHVAKVEGITLHLERFAAKPADVGASADGAFTVALQRSGLELEVPADRSILDVVEEAGITVPSSCWEGVCGSCETRVVAGSVDHRDSVLSPAERAAGTSMFICVSRSLGDRLVLDI